MKNSFEITASSDRELRMTRVFAAPRRLVFDAYTRPESVKRWLLGPVGWTMPVCEIDLRVGGKYRYVWRHEKDGREMGMGGVFREISPPDRFVVTEKFDEAWYPGEALSTVVLTERDGKTTLVLTVKYESKAALDAVLKSPMEEGVKAGFDRLEKILLEQGTK
jgi:uncharacterized protein YndB with AHSA1/START domain